jgi:hypothetical protein
MGNGSIKWRLGDDLLKCLLQLFNLLFFHVGDYAKQLFDCKKVMDVGRILTLGQPIRARCPGLPDDFRSAPWGNQCGSTGSVYKEHTPKSISAAHRYFKVVFDSVSSYQTTGESLRFKLSMSITKNPAWLGGVFYFEEKLYNPPVSTQFVRIL